jgi:hypothetical protein
MGTLQTVFISSKTMECRGSPESPLRTPGVFELFKNFFFQLTRNKPFPIWSLFGDESIDTIGVEGPDDSFISLSDNSAVFITCSIEEPINSMMMTRYHRSVSLFPAFLAAWRSAREAFSKLGVRYL